MLTRVVRVVGKRRLGALSSTSWSVSGGANTRVQGGHRFGRKPTKQSAPFGELASQQLARVQRCVEVLKEANPTFSCEMIADERVDIAIENEHGEARFELTLQTAKEQLQLYSTDGTNTRTRARIQLAPLRSAVCDLRLVYDNYEPLGLIVSIKPTPCGNRVRS